MEKRSVCHQLSEDESDIFVIASFQHLRGFSHHCISHVQSTEFGSVLYEVKHQLQHYPGNVLIEPCKAVLNVKLFSTSSLVHEWCIFKRKSLAATSWRNNVTALTDSLCKMSAGTSPQTVGKSLVQWDSRIGTYYYTYIYIYTNYIYQFLYNFHNRFRLGCLTVWVGVPGLQK